MKKVSPIDTWNEFINTLILAKEKWLVHKEVMIERRTIEDLPIEAQRQLRYTDIHRASDFARMLLQFIHRWRTSGGLTAMVITLKPDESEKKKNEKSKPESPPDSKTSSTPAA